ncbi:hypothetical protein FWK35_00029553 [Aphis craccivora]|uniref:Uncharacterized protein n=1 Tax=Aphis craccivora TaxID=307492 RepID=A0A6G0XFP1_APHCR|nr:hypothetical protein FWK35_00029553 [Aphis craccivora]
MFTFDLYNAPKIFTLPSKPPPKFEIESLFRLVMLYTHTHTNTHHCKINRYIHHSVQNLK